MGEIIDTAKVAVFFLDHRQSVRGNEIGSVGLIQEYAGRSDIPFSTYDLTTEFRCAGSASYIRWVDYLFGLRDNRSLAWKNQDEYEVRIFDDVQEMEGALRQRMDAGFSARMVAGFSWPWSDPNEDGSLVPDVAIGDWARPWNRKPKDMWRRRKGSGESPATHPYKIWATTDEGFDQVGCIYSAQGFEFDYVGLIVGSHLRLDPVNSRWMADLRQNEDVGFKGGLPSKDMAVDKLKQIYRVLATRGMKGTYLCFLDGATRDHVDRVGVGCSAPHRLRS